jgi:tRNA pseudouridine55 synthase
MILAFDKPKGPTSFKFLSQIKKIAGTKKVGHAGTLDPLASGVLVVAIGRQSTKKIHLEVQKEKEYLAEIKLGAYSTTDDEEGEKEVTEQGQIPDVTFVKKTVDSFVGKIQQTPPVYSAIKINGQESYKLARKGKTVELKPREVTVKSIQILEYAYPKLVLKVVTGPGVYIRSLARNIGEKLETGGYISELRMTRVGEFTVEKTTGLEALSKMNKDVLSEG